MSNDEENIIISKHTAPNQKTSLKKLKFIMQSLIKENNTIKNILTILRNIAMVKKSAHLILQAVESCLNNMRHEYKQKNLQFIGEGIVNIYIGRSQGLKRRMFRAKGSTSPIEKHRANIKVEIINNVIKKTEIKEAE